MNKVIAALDNSLAATPVLATARALAEVLDCEMIAVHVAVDGDRIAQNAAAQLGLPLRKLEGRIVPRLLDEIGRPDVSAVVLGAHGTLGDRRTFGGTAAALAETAAKPLVVVPPDMRMIEAIHRVLIPIDTRLAGSLTPRAAVELARGAELDVVALHVHHPASLPAFTDQPQHEHAAWTREYLRRYCPWGIDEVRLEVRTGNAEDIVPLIAHEAAVDVIAIGWASELTESRAPIVRGALSRAKVPVMLVPVHVPSPELMKQCEREIDPALSMA